MFLLGFSCLILSYFGGSVQLVSILHRIEQTEGRRYVPCSTKLPKTLGKNRLKGYVCKLRSIGNFRKCCHCLQDPCLEEPSDTRSVGREQHLPFAGSSFCGWRMRKWGRWWTNSAGVQDPMQTSSSEATQASPSQLTRSELEHASLDWI